MPPGWEQEAGWCPDEPEMGRTQVGWQQVLGESDAGSSKAKRVVPPPSRGQP